MKIERFIIALLCLFLLSCSAKPGAKTVADADKLFKAGNESGAKALYLKAAELGNADAHFALAYKYVVPEQEGVYHFSEAAKRGHSEALGYALDGLLFRADSLTAADPQKALDIFNAALKANPRIELFDMAAQLDTIKKCVEAGPFDGEAFIKKYGIKKDELNGFYCVWKIAEEASKGGRFGKPDPKLTFLLISRGGFVPAEFIGAVRDFYGYWKGGVVKVFDICDYAGSGAGLTLCSQRAAEVSKKDFKKRLNTFAAGLDKTTGSLAAAAYEAARAYISEKAEKEEGHDGSGYHAWEENSKFEQETAFFDLLEKIRKGFVPEGVKEISFSEKEMEEKLAALTAAVKAKPIDGMKFLIDDTTIKSVQKTWEPYRDKCADLFTALSPGTKETMWKSWLTQARTDELKKVEELGKVYDIK